MPGVAPTIADGPIGLGGEHLWQSSHNAYDQAVILGHQAYDSARNVVLPRFKLDRIPGFYALAEYDDPRGPRVGRVGEIPYPSDRSSKTIVYEGRVQARNYLELARETNKLRAAFAGTRFERFMAVRSPLGGTEWGFWARALQLDVDDELAFGPDSAPTPWQYKFVLGVRMTDPRFFAQNELQAATDAAPPLQVTMTNEGSQPADPVITVSGLAAGANVTLERPAISGGVQWAGDVETGPQQLVFEDLPAGDLYVNFYWRVANVGGVDVIPKLNGLASTWWDEGVQPFPPGEHTISASNGTQLHVEFFPAA